MKCAEYNIQKKILNQDKIETNFPQIQKKG